MSTRRRRLADGRLADADSPTSQLADVSTRRRSTRRWFDSPTLIDKNMNELLSASRPSASRTIGELTVGELTRRRVDMSASRRRRVDHRRGGVGELNCSLSAEGKKSCVQKWRLGLGAHEWAPALFKGTCQLADADSPMVNSPTCQLADGQLADDSTRRRSTRR
ncbi:hypothetical protein GPALN_013098 [Globodera pallida]|nr:hypothetical protein GPALN_013098 [Globodera pallida]